MQKKRQASLKAFVYDNQLTLNFNIKPLNNEKFPDSTMLYNWYVRFYYNNKIVCITEFLTNTNLYDEKNRRNYNSLVFNLNNFSKNENLSAHLDLPIVFLSDVKAGEAQIIVELFECYDTLLDTMFTYSYIKQFSNLKFSWIIHIEMPKIYHSRIYSNEIILQDDESFFPKGMDFSFREGLSDIYWTITYPLKRNRKTGNIYWKSREATYAISYTYLNTIDILHLTKKDKLLISVYDRDDFSKDDFIGDWYGHLLTLYSDTFKTLVLIMLYRLK